MSRQTAVEWLFNKMITEKHTISEWNIICKEAKQMEKKQSQNYAIFAIRCDRTEMRILEFNDYIKLEENENK